MRTPITQITFVLISSIFLIGMPNGCASTLSVRQNQHWIDLPNGRKIVYQPVDSLLVIEFVDTLKSAQKREIIKQLDLKIVPIRIRNNQDVQDIHKSILILGISSSKYANIKERIRQNYQDNVRGVLSAFELDNRLCYLRPTTFGISFYGDVHQDSVFALLQKYQLTVHDRDKIKVNPYPFYVMRLAYVDTKSHANLFEIIREVSREPEVYSAFPLFVESGYALVHGPTPIATAHKLIRNEPPFLTKVGPDLKKLFWVWKTADLDIVNQLAYSSVVTISNDSVKVDVVFSQDDVGAIYELVAEKGVRSLYPIKKIGDKYRTVAFVAWQSIESLALSDKVSYIEVNRSE